MAENKVTLYGYWRSGATYRTRIMLNLKNIKYEYVPINLLKDENKSPEFMKINPMGLVPTLQINDQFVHNSFAIIRLLEKLYPSPALKFSDDFKNAELDFVCSSISEDTQPLGNSSVLNYLKNTLHKTNEEAFTFARFFIKRSFDSIEKIIAKKNHTYAMADNITFADIFLVPQTFTAKRYGFDVSSYENIMRVTNNANKLEPFINALPEKQPDFPKS